jgi:hypothetical protein
LHVYGLRKPDTVTAKINGKAAELKQDWDASNARLVVSVPGLTPTDELDLELSVNDGTLLDERDLREEKVRKMLRIFRLESLIKQRIDLALPMLLADPNQIGQAASYLSDAQLAALKYALEK